MYKRFTIGIALIGLGILIGTQIENFEFTLELKPRRIR